MRSIRFYRTSLGKCPVEEFLDSLPDRDARRITWVLRLVEKLDIVPMQYFKKLKGTGEFWEIRAQASGNSYRLLGFFDGPAVLVLISGFSKKGRLLPAREIRTAGQRKAEYFERKHGK